MAGQEANGDNLGMSFPFSVQQQYVQCTHLNQLNEVILMNIHNMQFPGKIRKISLNICFI